MKYINVCMRSVCPYTILFPTVVSYFSTFIFKLQLQPPIHIKIYSKMLRDCVSFDLTLMLLVANLANTKRCKILRKMSETLAHGYSSESTQRKLCHEYQHDSVQMIFKNGCLLVHLTKVASAFEWLKEPALLFSMK